MGELSVAARFWSVTLVLREDDVQRANELYTDALAICDCDWSACSGL